MNNIKNHIASILVLLTVVFVGISCVNEKHDNDQSTAATNHSNPSLPYDLTHPEQYNMPHNLFEISGIVFHNGDPKEVFAIQDEDGDLFHLGLGDKKSKFVKFGKKGDYEDLTIIDNYVVVLKSNGALYHFPFNEINNAEIANVVETKDLVPKAEYEGLAADEKNGLVYILTKESRKGKSDETEIFSYKFDQGKFTPAESYVLSNKELAKIAGESKLKFRPSALCKNPLTGEWYIISSINKLLVVTDANFKLKSAHPLKGDFFNQPEGIAFDRDNNLYISNEGGTLSAGNILMFKLKGS